MVMQRLIKENNLVVGNTGKDGRNGKENKEKSKEHSEELSR